MLHEHHPINVIDFWPVREAAVFHVSSSAIKQLQCRKGGNTNSRHMWKGEPVASMSANERE